MKKIILFAVSMSAVLLGGCLPQQKLTGRVVDTTGPVPGAAVLAMVWVEDSGKALPAPDTAGLAGQELDVALEKDMAERGLPKAYARAFTDDSGEFALDKLHFSAETKKAVKAMTQPKITRVTVNAFQRGYLKHAATMFPKGISDELAPAVVKLSRPTDWKQLALDNYFRLLRRDEFDNGYSKHFGATRGEKKWFLDYMSGNLNDAHQASNIKGDKQWVEDCGHDFSDIMVSSAGIQYNPAREKCNLLLRQAGILRDWEELWLTHAYSPVAGQSPAVSAIKEAIDGLGPEYAEVRQYEAQIIAGAGEAMGQYNRGQGNADLRNGLNEVTAVPVEAQRLYNSGDKAGAYSALGYSLFNALPAELKRGVVTAMLPVTIVPKIKETSAGFYLLVNRPLTAQLPGGDNGNHKDKPKTEVDKSTETNKTERNEIEISTSIVRFVDRDGKLRKEIPLKTRTTREKVKANRGDLEIEITHSKIPVVSKNKKYVLINEKTNKVPVDRKRLWEYEHSESNELTLYRIDGTLAYKKQFPEDTGFHNGSQQIAVSDNGVTALILENDPMKKGKYWTKLYTYDENGNLILTYPDEKTIVDSIDPTMLDISPNGRYLAISVAFPYPEPTVTVFFDLKKKTWWKGGIDYVVYAISDTGIAITDYPNPKIPDNADRKKVKEPLRIRENFDLTKHFGE